MARKTCKRLDILETVPILLRRMYLTEMGAKCIYSSIVLYQRRLEMRLICVYLFYLFF